MHTIILFRAFIFRILISAPVGGIFNIDRHFTVRRLISVPGPAEIIGDIASHVPSLLTTATTISPIENKSGRTAIDLLDDIIMCSANLIGLKVYGIVELGIGAGTVNDSAVNSSHLPGLFGPVFFFAWSFKEAVWSCVRGHCGMVVDIVIFVWASG